MELMQGSVSLTKLTDGSKSENQDPSLDLRSSRTNGHAQKNENNKKISGYQGLGWREMNKQRTEDLQYSENTPYDITMVDICHYTFV